MAENGEGTPPAGEKNGEGSGGEGQDKLFTQEQLEGLIKDRVGRLRKEITKEVQKDIRGELLADDAFRTEALDHWKVKPGKGESGDGGSLDDAKVQELHEAWAKKNLDPIRTQNTELQQEVQSLRMSGLEAKLLTVAGPLVIEGLMKQQGKDGHSALFNMTNHNFEWDPEVKDWRVMGPDGEPRPSPSGDRLYMTPEEWLKTEWAADPANAPFIRDHTQGGSDFQGRSKVDGGKRTYTKSEYRKLVSDQDYYDNNRDELLAAEREGRVR